MSLAQSEKFQANLFYYIGAFFFTTGIWSTFLLPAANDAAKNIGTKDSFGQNQQINRRYANFTSWFNQPHLTISDSQKRIFYRSVLCN